MEIKKAGFYKNWFEIASGLADQERLAFYDMIFNYYFLQEEPGEEAPAIIKSLFLAVRANIEADLNRKKGGAPEGNQNAVKTKENKENQSSCFTIDLKKSNKVKVNDNVNDNVNVKVNDNNTDLNYTYYSTLLNHFIDSYGLKLGAKVKQNIYIFMDGNSLDEKYLQFCYEYILEKYPDKNAGELSKLFSSAVTDWPDLLKTYKTRARITAKKAKSKIIYKVAPPEACSFCGSKLEPGALPGTVECPVCREAGQRTWWEYDGDKWNAIR